MSESMGNLGERKTKSSTEGDWKNSERTRRLLEFLHQKDMARYEMKGSGERITDEEVLDLLFPQNRLVQIPEEIADVSEEETHSLLEGLGGYPVAVEKVEERSGEIINDTVDFAGRLRIVMGEFKKAIIESKGDEKSLERINRILGKIQNLEVAAKSLGDEFKKPAKDSEKDRLNIN